MHFQHKMNAHQNQCPLWFFMALLFAIVMFIVGVAFAADAQVYQSEVNEQGTGDYAQYEAMRLQEHERQHEADERMRQMEYEQRRLEQQQYQQRIEAQHYGN